MDNEFFMEQSKGEEQTDKPVAPPGEAKPPRKRTAPQIRLVGKELDEAEAFQDVAWQSDIYGQAAALLRDNPGKSFALLDKISTKRTAENAAEKIRQRATEHGFAEELRVEAVQVALTGKARFAVHGRYK